MNKIGAQQALHYPARLKHGISFWLLLVGVINALGLDQAPREELSVYTDLHLLQMIWHEETDVWNLWVPQDRKKDQPG